MSILSIDKIKSDLGEWSDFQTIYENREFHVKDSSFVDTLRSALTIDGFEEILWLAGNLKPSRIQIAKVESILSREDIERGDILRLSGSALRNGQTVVVNYAEEFSPLLARTTRSLSEYFRCPIYSSVFLTPSGASCFLPHTDGIDVLAAQVVGKKKWILDDGPIHLAKKKHSFTSPVYSKNKRMYLLEAGGLLYVPRGMVHEVINDENDLYSLHVSFGIHAVRRVDVIKKAATLIEDENLSLRATMAGSMGFGHFPNADDLSSIDTTAKSMLSSYNLRLASSMVNAERISMLYQIPSTRLKDSLKMKDVRKETVIEKCSGMICELVINKENDEGGIAFPGSGTKGIESEGVSINAPSVALSTFEYIVKAKEEFLINNLPGLINVDGKLNLARKLIDAGLFRVVRY